MITRRQKSKVTNQVLQRFFESGVKPSVSTLLRRVAQTLEGRRWGEPLTRYRPAIPKLGLIGGPRGTDLQDTFQELQGDVETLFEECAALARRTVDVYAVLATRKAALRRRLSRILNRAGALERLQTEGGRLLLEDSFEDTVGIESEDADLMTTAEIDTAEGCAKLPANPQLSVRFDASRARLVSESLSPGGVARGGSFLSTLNDAGNDAWHASFPTEEGTYVAVIDLTGQPNQVGNTDEFLLNSLTLDPTGPLRLQVDSSNDGYNWEVLVPEQPIQTHTTWSVGPRWCQYLRFTLRGREPGVKRIQFARVAYADSAVLYSRELPLRTGEEFLAQTVPQEVHLDLEAEVPAGCRITPYLGVEEDDGTRRWIEMTAPALVLNTFVEQRVEDARLSWQPLTDQDPDAPYARGFFTAEVGVLPLPGTGTLYRGVGQVQIQALRHLPTVLAQTGGEALEIPGPDLWAQLAEQSLVRSGLFSLNTLQRGSHVLGQNTRDFYPDESPRRHRSPLARATFTDAGGRDYPCLYLALRQGVSGEAGSQIPGEAILQPGYHYRLSTTVYCGRAATVTGFAVTVNGTGATSAPGTCAFSLYLNGDRIAASNTAYSTGDYAALPAVTRQVVWNFREGANRIDLYLYRGASGFVAGATGLLPATGIPPLEASGDVGIYLYPDFLSAYGEGDAPLFDAVLAEPLPMTRVLSFDLKYNVAPEDHGKWAWLGDHLDASEAARRKILLNYDPRDPTLLSEAKSEPTLDGVHLPGPDRFLLTYRAANTGTPPRALRLRFDFERHPTAAGSPKLQAYRLRVI